MSPARPSPSVSTTPRPAPRRLINGVLIDTIRRNLGLTIVQYADMCGVPRKTMERICAGKNKPDGEHLLSIIVLGHVSPRLLELDGWRRYS